MIQHLILMISILSCSVMAYSVERNPNVILIMADDISWECFGSYGSTEYQTPNIDALAKEGVRFNHCYSTPICTTSRVKIMTGQYNFRNYTHFGYLNPKDKTFGQLMQSAGYKTAIAGKWQLNGLYHTAEKSKDNKRANHAGFDEYCLWQLTQDVKKKGTGMTERFWSPPLEQNGKVLTVQDNNGKYGPDIISDFVCDFIERYQDEPFFVYYPMVLVHDPFVATPDTIGSKPRTQAANIEPESSVEKKENFIAMVNYMDHLVGKIVKKVKEIGQLDNTIIMFTADNGTNRKITSQFQGETIRGGKGNTTDMGTHVPMIAYWKGQTPIGEVSNDLVDFTDFYATVAEVAGVKLGQDDPIDGRSFLSQLKGDRGDPRDWVLCHYQPYWGKFKGEQYVRDAQFKLYRDNRFFNVSKDLQQQNNLILGLGGIEGEVTRGKLQNLLDNTMPPSPPIKGGKKASYRPLYSDWKNIVNPHD